MSEMFIVSNWSDFRLQHYVREIAGVLLPTPTRTSATRYTLRQAEHMIEQVLPTGTSYTIEPADAFVIAHTGDDFSLNFLRSVGGDVETTFDPCIAKQYPLVVAKQVAKNLGRDWAVLNFSTMQQVH